MNYSGLPCVDTSPEKPLSLPINVFFIEETLVEYDPGPGLNLTKPSLFAAGCGLLVLTLKGGRFGSENV